MKLAVGFLTYNHFSAKYLSIFLESLQNQTFKDFKVFVMDNSDEENNKNSKYIKENYPQIDIEWSGSNLGFAKGQNKLIKKAIEAKAEYYLVLNPDTFLERNFIEILVAELDKNPECASISPKILKWDFEYNIKTDIIDSCGIKLKNGLRFFDLGQNQVDLNKFDEAQILGPSGAAGLYRVKALQTISEKGQFFDERMFMYKEDCDLAYRLYYRGFKSKCAGQAVIYHDRTSSGRGEGSIQIALNRKNKSRQAKLWSLRNHNLILKKHWKKQNLENKLYIIVYQIEAFSFILLFERYLLKEYFGVFRKL